MTTVAIQPSTMLKAVMDALARAARYNSSDVVPPAVVLWTDEDSQWQPVVDRLRPLMPALLEYGDFEPARRRGQAIWLRCVIEDDARKREFAELDWPDEKVPVIYLPGVSRQMLRAGEDCREDLKPLVELQYRGTVWTQKNGRDWTVLAFLVNQDGGLGLEVAEDQNTLDALLGCLPELAQTPLSTLRGRRLEASDFRRILEPDLTRALLAWLDDPEVTRQAWGNARWQAFRSQCRDEYAFDPEADGELVAGRSLGLREGVWLAVWQRFVESPGRYPNIPTLLRRAKPDVLIFDKEPWPDENETQETRLRQALLELGDVNPAEARRRIAALEVEHGLRRSWVWAGLGWCPLARALEHLTQLALQTARPSSAGMSSLIAEDYAEQGYLSDEAALRVLACAKTQVDVEAVSTAVRAVYFEWLEDLAKSFQKSLKESTLPSALQQGPIQSANGDCLIFVDGLRYDLGQRLSSMAAGLGLRANLAWRWAALPTVTPSAKPAASPVVASLTGNGPGVDFAPVTLDKGSVLTSDRFRKLLDAKGFQVLEASDTGDPDRETALGWTECGQLDKMGHEFGCRLAGHADGELELVLERVNGLLAAGWQRVQVVTDHGWLIMPGGLPKHDLPKYLTESKWPRFAAIKESAQVKEPVAQWSWNDHHWFAYAPGICCYREGNVYAHGGISVQETVIPVLVIQRSKAASPVQISFSELTWRGMRCRIAVEPAGEGLVADLRTKPNVAACTISGSKPLDVEGKASLVVSDDSLEGTMVSAVITDAAGRIICQRATVVGEESR